MSGCDRRHFGKELRKGEEAHAAAVRGAAAAHAEADRALARAHRLDCEACTYLQFIGGDAAPSPTIAAALHGGCELLDVKCRRSGHESIVDLAEVTWPRDKQIHTLAGKLRCKACKDDGKKPQPQLIGLQTRHPDPEPPARAANKVSR
jgi:hypothetical protein